MVFLTRSAMYVPKCNGNRDLPIDEQVRFQVRAMTGTEEEKLSTLFAYTDNATKMVMEPKAIETFLSQVDEVKGVWADKEKKQPIATAAEFVKLPGTYEYITECVAFIRRGLEEKELKN